ncbi:MAG: hypothetical protein MZV64_71075 [Ignavibacteriales bacterium]|nr:hypothetical protein [Ignavibacteriales bacterium]
MSVSEALMHGGLVASNQLILAGSDAQLTLIESIITELNRAQENLPRRETKLIDVGPAAELQQLLPMVQQLYQDRWKSKDAADPPSAQFMADPQQVLKKVVGALCVNLSNT